MTQFDRILIGALLAIICLAVLLSLLGERPSGPQPTDDAAASDVPQLEITPLGYSDISGWDADTIEETLGALALSCNRLDRLPPDRLMGSASLRTRDALTNLYGRAGIWQETCAELLESLGTTTEANQMRGLFESLFTPIKLAFEDDNPKIATGYFEPSYPARRSGDENTVPVLTMPNNLVTVDLGEFASDLSGRSIIGQFDGQSFTPYNTNAEILAAAPPGSEALGFVDPTDLLFLQIQGSGRLAFDDGSVLRVGYAGKNGRAYTAVGRTLVAQGAMELPDVTMASIASWLKAAPRAEADAVRASNESYVFFRPLLDLDDPSLGPVGAQGVQLTPFRSIAIDHRFYPYGAPIWLSTQMTALQDEPFDHLVIAQDTGGAIRGPHRADIFYGWDDQATILAGAQNADAELIVFVPTRQIEAWTNGQEE